MPDMVGIAVKGKNIIHGDIEKRMIYGTLLRNSDFDKILATCRYDWTKKEYLWFIDPFPYVFKTYLEKGFVENEIFERLGFLLDKDVYWYIVSTIPIISVYMFIAMFTIDMNISYITTI